MAVLDVLALDARRRAVLQAKEDAVRYATQAVNEFAAVANQIGVPYWRPNDALRTSHQQSGFRQGYVLLRDANHNDFWMTEAFGGVVGADGRHLLRHSAASSEELGQWIAGQCHYDQEAIERVFTMALTDVPLSNAQL